MPGKVLSPMTEKDLYAALGVPRTAPIAEIKKVYRKLARKYHPDVNPGNKEAEERFKQISEANDILSDPEKRKLYDEFGMIGVQSGFDADKARAYREQAQGWEGASRGAGGGGRQGFAGYTNFEDVFGDIFGGDGGREGAFRDGGFHEGGFREAAARGADAEYELEIGLLDALRGLSTTITIQRPEVCPTCAGSGADPGSATTCPECKGQGRIRVGQGPVEFMRTCPRCGGVGKVSTKPCPTCGGAGQKVTTEKLNVHIPPGVDNGSRVRVAGKGGPGHAGAPPGDLYIRVKVRPHPLLERRGHDLYMDLPVTVSEAMLGASIEVPTLETTVRVRVPAHSQSGRQLRVRGHGAPQLRGKERGDLYLKLVVHVPDRDTPEAAEAARTLDAVYTHNPREGLRL
jgi:molecular chaperone DnaJ